MNQNILIGGAWPYANGSLHIGHIAGLLPADVIARYHRANGDHVYYVSGSDCYGTPVTIRAKEEKKTPLEVSDYYHEEFKECFKKLGFSYDLYGKTTMKEHNDFVREFHKKLYQSEYVYEKEAPQAYCPHCNSFLADRYVEGICPKCKVKARGDQCDSCGSVLEPEQLIKPTCKICGTSPEFRTSKHLYLAISKLEKELQSLVDTHPEWRKNAISFTNRYIKEGLRDRAITRDLDWGVDVPKEGYEDKKIYIWAENVLGYLSMSEAVAKLRGEKIEKLWGKDAIHYYVHAKDNIPFHTIILPSLLLAHGEINNSDVNYHLPDKIISNEYLTLEGDKISTSRNYAIWVKDIIDKYQADSIRYFLITNGPEKRDTDFTYREFIQSHNSELLGAYGNLINRTIVFIQKYFNSKVPSGVLDTEIEQKLKDLYIDTGIQIENGDLKEALDHLFHMIRLTNKYFDYHKPWETRNSDIDHCKNTLYNCVQVIANLSVLLSPFLPFSSDEVIEWFSLDKKWTFQTVEEDYVIPKTHILFERIDSKKIAEETERLKGKLNEKIKEKLATANS
ncbi:methionine--tRNA ligase [Anaeromicropila herbilytica]|uniref:Methionine--tRNA ligase n=1 Tax=Anaeromicropila herbilytica TaxID=2785025 RepID=A0A7R7EKU0_9FIRM|nr:methionine--tRNA ligase [Anaeromicropila herbilytica]BCN30675.1 methionine--tRNA ligase 1 [Anaeromicropila herbilytica]